MNRFLQLLYTLIILVVISSCSEEGPHKKNILQFNAILDKTDTPASASTAKGRGIFEYNKSARELKYNINYQNMVPTAVTLNTGGSAPRVVHILKINPAGNQALGTIPNVSEEDQNMLLNGQLFVNITSTVYPAGEIRGQIVIGEIRY